MKTALLVTVLLAFLLFSGTALAEWPSGSQGDQYASVNAELAKAAADVGISSGTFISIYNAAISGNVSGFSDSQLDAACDVMKRLGSYKSVLTDYDSVYGKLGCSSRTASTTEPSVEPTSEASPDSTRRALPGTRIAIGLLAGSGIVGIGAAWRMLRKGKKE